MKSRPMIDFLKDFFEGKLDFIFQSQVKGFSLAVASFSYYMTHSYILAAIRPLGPRPSF
jgi:hypothetical protein